MRRVVLTITALVLIAAISALFLSFGRAEEIVDPVYEPDASHGEYLTSLENMNLHRTVMGEEWAHAGTLTANPTSLSLLPLQETRYFERSAPDAAYYLFEGIRGQSVEILIEPDSEAGFFVDLFGLPGDFDPREIEDGGWNGLEFDPIASGSSEAHELDGTDPSAQIGTSRIVFEPRRHRYYLLRIQPRLLEGGTRVHHGVDIFAPKGTPIYAVADARVRRVGERDRGGKTVSLHDEKRNIRYYYAHLDEYADLDGVTHVAEGTLLGYVGNTGNALGGPDHLHFGIYDQSPRRPLDPWYFLVPVDDRPVPAPDPDELQNITGLQLGALVSFNDTPIFYDQVPGRSTTPVAPTLRDHRGTPLDAKDRPVTVLSWEGEFAPTTVGVADATEVFDNLEDRPIRLVALRHNALGFLFPNRRIRWKPYESDIGTRIATR